MDIVAQARPRQHRLPLSPLRSLVSPFWEGLLARGLPAAGMADPTVDELVAIVDLDTLFTWASVAGRLREAFLEALGGPLNIRDIAGVPWDIFDTCVRRLAIPIDGEDEVAGASPIQMSRLFSLRRATRRKVGLDPSEGTDRTPPAAPPADASSSALVLHKDTPRRVKLSSLVDGTIESELVPLDTTSIRDLFARYKATRGDFPHQDIEPSSDQLSAIHQLIKSNSAPYADFSIYGPHGRRTLRKLTFTSLLYNAVDGSYKRTELPGPPDFESWWKCWMVYRCALLLLDAVRTEPLELYGELIRTFVQQYGQQCWFLIYQADVRMRSEEFERIRRRASIDMEAMDTGDRVPDDLGKPWNSVFLAAVRHREFWDAEIRDKAFLYLAKVHSRAQVTHDGTGFQPSVDQSTQPPSFQGTKRRFNNPSQPSRHRPHPFYQGSSPSSGHAAPTAGATQQAEKCNLWNAGKCADVCPHSRVHRCSKCNGAHRRINCNNDAKGKSKGKGKSAKR